MSNVNFSEIASKYERDSLVQKSAAEKLINLLRISRNDNVLDLGCGTGHLTKRIREMTKGKVIGIDSSEGMIKEAQRRNAGIDIIFEIKKAEELDYVEFFDVIFCNSSFQWFKNPEPIIKSCYRALRKNGRMGIQAPAKKIYCPNFIQGI
ncbi:class I SAM-dependent methyltransferase [Thermodesulfovibrio sp. TK110]